MHLKKLLVVALIASVYSGCADDAEIPAPGNEPVGVLNGDSGKFDGVTFAVRDYFRHTKELLLRDLVDRAASLATDQLNDLLDEVPWVDLKVSETALFGLEEGFEGGSEINGLSKLKSGLTKRFGETDFLTQINAIREAHLASGADTYFAESSFNVSLSGSTAFHTEVEDVPIVLGFRPQTTLVATMVGAHDGNVEAILKNPLQAFKEVRGFILPRGVEDMRKMKPGEAIALSGQGVFGLNIAANIPVYSFSPVDHLLLTARFSLGGHIQLEGGLDVQLIRGESDLLYLDVGIREAQTKGLHAGLSSGWGLTDVPDLLEVSIGSHSFSLGDIAAKALRNYVDKKGLLSYGVEGVSSSASERITLQRFRMNLEHGDPAVEAAIKQAVGGDLRLAQTLADRPDSGVTGLVSFERQLNSQRRYLGAHLMSMRFFSEVNEAQGVVYIDDGTTLQEILFDVLAQSTGKFWRKWGSKRTVVTSQTWTGGELQGATSNLRVAVSEADKFTDRDQVLDHVDAALLALVDMTTLYGDLTKSFEQLQHKVDLTCEECDDEDNDPLCEDEYEECVAELITETEVASWKADLEAAVAPVVQGVDSRGYDPAFSAGAEAAQSLFDLKLALSAVQEQHYAFDSLAGRSSLLSDVRFTEAGLSKMFAEVEPDVFMGRLEQVLVLIVSKRSKEHDTKFDKALDWVEDEDDKLEDMRDIYAEARAEWLRLDDMAAIRIEDQPIGSGAFILADIGVGQDIEVTIRSIAEMRGAVVAKMYDDLVERADDLGLLQSVLKILSLGLADTLGFESHHLVAYTLLGLVGPADREWLVNMDFEEDAFADVKAYTRGDGGGFIEAGQFDLDAAIGQ